jgi:glycosyltransferase involved in cell wall biosynthesis
MNMAIDTYNYHAQNLIPLGRVSAGASAPAIEPATPGHHHRTVTAVIPTLNEEHNIAWVIERIPATVDEVLIVDGHSVDRTVEIARAVRPDVVIVPQEGRGKGSALRTAFAAAGGDYIVVLDADCSMDPAEIDYYVAALDEGYEFVKGSRYLKRGGSLDLTAIRSLGNKALVNAVNLLWEVSMTDLCYGYFALRRDRYHTLGARSTGFEIECELIVNALNEGLLMAEVPSIELCRQHGVSNLSAWRDGRRVLWTLLSRRLHAPSRRHGSRARAVVNVLEDELSFTFRRRPALTDRPVPESVAALTL